MKTLSVPLPEGVDEQEAKMLVAGVLFEKGILSSGRAADVAGVSKRYFLENISRFGFSIFDEDTFKTPSLDQ